MRTHELARALSTLARVLKASPDIELSDLDLTGSAKISSVDIKKDAPLAISVLASLARYNKSEWATLIRELDLGVPVKPTDSTRDILGRLLTHLNENEAVRNRLAHEARKPNANVSPELMSALTILLKR